MKLFVFQARTYFAVSSPRRQLFKFCLLKNSCRSGMRDGTIQRITIVPRYVTTDPEMCTFKRLSLRSCNVTCTAACETSLLEPYVLPVSFGFWLPSYAHLT